MSSQEQDIEAALAAWREADRKLAAGVDGDTETTQGELERHREDFRRLSAEHMMDQLDALKGAEQRRGNEVPSTDAYHAAARDERRIATDIMRDARANDEDIPGSEDQPHWDAPS